MPEDFAHGGHDITKIGVAHRRENRQREQPLVSLFGAWTQAASMAELLRVERVPVYRHVVNIYADALSAQRPKSARAIHGGVELQDVKMKRVCDARRAQRTSSAQLGKRFVIRAREFLPTRNPSGSLLSWLEPSAHCRSERR